MKKMQKLAFLCLLSCPLALFAAQTNVSNVPNVSNVQEDQSLSISSDMLGLKGPFSLSTIYSKTFGLILEGKYTQLLNSSNALSFELDGGKAERRVGATWGHVLTSNQRIKLTAENLSQKMDFDFDSGNVSRWVYQNAIGGSYQYLLPHNLIKDVNLSAYYSKANNQDLGSKDFTTSGVLFRNYRRIAGATDKSVSAGIDVSPIKSTLIGLQLNYDNIKYDMRYQKAPNQDDKGLGATISLHQLVNDRLQFSLLASDRKSYKDYQAEVDWLLNSAPGSQLQLGLIGERIDANFGLPNDNRVGLQLSYSWGGDSASKPITFSDPVPNNNADGLKDWANAPAVHMAQVLAIKDQKTEKVNGNTKAAPKSGVNESADFHYNKDHYKDLPITYNNFHVGTDEVHLKYGDQSDQDNYPPLFVNKNLNMYGMKIDQDGGDVQGLPKSGDLKVTITQWTKSGYKIGNNCIQIDGKPTQADFDENPDHCIDITITAHKTALSKNDSDQAVATIKIKPAVVSPIIKMQKTSYHFKEGDTVSHVDLATITANPGTTIDADDINLDSSDHGVILDPAYKIDCDRKDSCELYLKGAATGAMFNKPETVRLTVGNNLHHESKATFDLSIGGRPVVTKGKEDLGSQSCDVRKKIEPVKSYFDNPIDSGSTHFRLAANGVQDVTATYKIDVDSSGTLQSVDNMPEDAPVGPVDIKVYAKNDVGESLTYATYHLTVVDNTRPQITHKSDAVFQVSDVGKTSDDVIVIKSQGEEQLDLDSIHVTPDKGMQSLQHYNLKAQINPVDSQTATVKITTDGTVQNEGLSSYTVSAANKGEKSVSLKDVFKVKVNTDPKVPVIIAEQNHDYIDGSTVSYEEVANIDTKDVLAKGIEDIQIKPVGGAGYSPDHFGLSFVRSPVTSKSYKIHVKSINGQVVKNIDSQQYEIDVTNKDGKSATAYFTIKVIANPHAPVINLAQDTFTFDEGYKLSGRSIQIATVTSGKGEKFYDGGWVDVEPVDTNGKKYNPADFDLMYETERSSSHSKVIYRLVERGPDIEIPSDVVPKITTEQKYKITAKNDDGLISVKYFTFKVLAVGKRGVN